jgi:hypothetical protein
MKINSMEIIISFQQSEHVPLSSINKFLTGIDQSSKGCPFLLYLVRHLILWVMGQLYKAATYCEAA